MSQQKKFTAFDVLNRACELHIDVTLVGGDLKVKAKKGAVTDKVLSVIREHKQEVIDYLGQFEEAAPLCFTCLDTGKETPGVELHTDVWYCAEHNPARAPLKVGDGVYMIDGVRIIDRGLSTEQFIELLMKEARAAQDEAIERREAAIQEKIQQRRARRIA